MGRAVCAELDRIARAMGARSIAVGDRKALGVSRGKVAGAIDRARKAGDLRIPPRPPKARAIKPPDENVGNRRARPAPPPPPRPRLLIELRQGQCLWPVGEAADGRHLFCGQPRDSRRPYCEAHCAKAPRVSASPSSSSALPCGPSRLRESV